MILGFSGHRDRSPSYREFERLEKEFPDAIWRHGGAQHGFDSHVDTWARAPGKVPVVQVYYPLYGRMPADPAQRVPILFPERYGTNIPWVKAAPLKRDEEMVDGRVGEPPIDLLIALWDGRETGGTWYTKCYAEYRGIPFRVWEAFR
jgi:hypothetical protein